MSSVDYSVRDGDATSHLQHGIRSSKLLPGSPGLDASDLASAFDTLTGPSPSLFPANNSTRVSPFEAEFV